MFQMNPEWLPLTQLAAELQIFEFFFSHFMYIMPQAEKYQGKAPRGLACGIHRLLTPLWF